MLGPGPTRTQHIDDGVYMQCWKLAWQVAGEGWVGLRNDEVKLIRSRIQTQVGDKSDIIYDHMWAN